MGLVGVGRIGASHAEVVRDHPSVEELVVADANPERARQVGEKLGVRSVERVEDAYDGVDAVIVAAATAAHAELILRAASAGLPVFCEKPVAPDAASSRRVLREVERSGIPTHIGFQRRFDAGYINARTAVRSGGLGGLHRIHLVTGDPAPPPADYLPLSGGIFRDCHVHDFDILRWVTGCEVTEVYAVGANRGDEAFRRAGDVDNSAAVLTLDDGTLVTLQGSRYNGAGYDVRMELAGSRATHVVGLDHRVPVVSAEPDADFPAGHPWPSFWERFGPAYVAEMNAFVDVARGRIDSPCTVAEALEAMYIAEAADLSRREHRPVRLEEVRHA